MNILKRVSILTLVSLASFSLSAQQEDNYEKEPTVLERVLNLETKQDKFKLYLNMNGSFNADFKKGHFDQGKFHMRQLRIEAKGNLTDWLSYRYRQRLNRGNNPGNNIDNMPKSIDIAMIGVKLNDKFSIQAGKLCSAYGGIEFDLNPIEIYEYSDMIEYMSNFLTGASFIYHPNANHEFQFQVLDSRNGTIAEEYGDDNKIFEDSKLPLLYTLNWNGNFNNVFKTRWSASVMDEAKDKQMYHFAFGNQLSLDKFGAYFDATYTKHALDRKGILSEYSRQNTEYLALVLNMNYRFNRNWNAFVQGMYETASFSKDFTQTSIKTGLSKDVEKGKYRTALGYMAGIEYYPMESNLHFFLTYVGRAYKYTDKAYIKEAQTTNTNRVSVGFIYQLPMF